MSEAPLFDVVVAKGNDALAFLHSQFAADLIRLIDGELCWSALLNPQGRVLHVVAIWRLDAVSYLLLVPFRRGIELISALQKFVLRRKLTLAVDVDARVCADCEGVDCGLPDLRLRIGHPADADVLGVGALNQFIPSGLVLVDATAAGRHLAHALRLDRFAAFSVKKGCYPGQEIVARTHFLGRNKRLLVQLSTSVDVHLHSADPVFENNTEVGEVACAGHDMALAVLQRLPTVDAGLHASSDRTLVTIARTFS